MGAPEVRSWPTVRISLDLEVGTWQRLHECVQEHNAALGRNKFPRLTHSKLLRGFIGTYLANWKHSGDLESMESTGATA